MEEILQKIKDMRNVKGFSYENMADELKISTSTYRKIETGETNLTVERLFQIAEILQTPVTKLLGEKSSNVFYQTNKDSGTFNAYNEIENYYHQENREITQKMIKNMENEIEHLREEVAFLREITKAK